MTDPWFSLPGEPMSVPAARRFVSDRCQQWDALDDACEAAVLLTSELVTNGVLHARTRISIRIGHDDAHLRVEVRDGSPALPRARRFSTEAATGRGMRLLETIASSWGVDKVTDPEDPGKIVWFEVPLSGPGGAADSALAAAFAESMTVDWTTDA